MNIVREYQKPKSTRWSRYRHNLNAPLGENGKWLTGSKEHIALSRKVATEGMVLLKNNGLLPLRESTTVALFGVGSLEYIPGGGGSGRVYPAYFRNLYEGFAEKAPRIQIFEPLSQFYYDYAAPQVNSLKEDQILPEPELPADLIRAAAKEADVAIISIHRFSCEGTDRRAEKGDFYLTDEEQLLVDNVTAVFAHTVAVLNIGGVVDTQWIQNNEKIDGALLAWQAGMEGGAAIADILCGDVNPSGKLTDTFAKAFSDYPSADTFHDSDAYVEYFEDIYVGYRYFETIPTAAKKVAYPFGYGLSYTTFALSKPIAAVTGGQITVSLSVTNTGNLSGKEVVQVYYSAPQGVLGKSSICLAGFHKTKLLSPGETQEVSIVFDINDMASYDDTGKLCMSAYVLEQGQYRFFVGTNCRELTECDDCYTVSDKFRIVRQLQQRCAPNLLQKRMRADGSFEPLPAFPQVHYPAQTVPENKEPAPERIQPLSAVAEGNISLDAFVAQLTVSELIRLCCGIFARGPSTTGGWGGIDRLGIPRVMTADGPAGVRLHPGTGIATTAWPCATLLACTWDPELAYAIGVAGGTECKEHGIATWLTPGINIHRNPLCGRNFEYFSEDPYITGKFAAAKVRGIQSTCTAASVKHFATNNKETNRNYSDSRVSERALREIYLRGFEICVKEARPWTVMTSYNILNGRRTCECYELIEGILRQEWGFEGMTISDWHGPCNQEHCIIAGNDVRMPTGFPDVLQEAINYKRIGRGNLEVCAKRILQMIMKLD